MFEMIPFKNNDDFFSSTSINKGFNVDIHETESAYLVEADLPGMKKENLNLSYKNGYLTITAKREDIIEDRNEIYVRHEKHYTEFKRSFFINNIDKNNINAQLKNGVLKLVLPKKE
ncbi:Hsp20/alpha crystallin family protein [Clostridium botulinum]|uniref:Small heat shock protein n=1 Tax=Clostridium botulinum C/D str. DC5 TaxID=1443128 RepID=A0A0A0IB10_CLOBO|nr:Hsp20/alpha crystallin family protein [Clostridium botulinum]KEI01975.1 small heat shock protein [Clostridium botulinum C/D str. BKT75002]KEI10077.1 small heat shock protein [Clostridium botulinum C/D str. BKT2873]KGM96755.1 small heat shock protein [Clostridium botulinum C/D str. DC5]KGM98168.1 small heat shock protein [Clostridium botulinum D str. CCUG 7971]KOC50377.1 heat-shock protein Hsp20 [Clostridium botulinum]